MLRRWGFILLGVLFSLGLHAQMGVGTDMPDPAAELEIKSANKGLLIPRIGLTSNTDQSTITAGNIESLLVYNTTSNDNLNPGFYYWYNTKWRRLSDDNNLPDNIVIWDQVNQQFTFIDIDGNIQNIDLNLTETLTDLSLNADGKTLEYTDESGMLTSIDLAEIIQNYQNTFSLINGENTSIETTQSENNTEYQVNVPVAKGAQGNIASTYGVVKESPENPSITITQTGELSLNFENLNNVTLVNQDYTAVFSDHVILGETNSGNLTISLPDPTEFKGKKYTIKKEDTNEDYFIQVNGIISGIPLGEQLYTALPHTGWDLVSDGTTWRIVNKF